MDIYREQILDHYKNPRNWGTVEKPTTEAEGFNQLCGDAVKIQLVIEDSKITTMRFTGHGCAISMAAASLLSELVTDTTVNDVMQLEVKDVEQLLGSSLPPVRLKCGLLPLETIQLACTKFK